MANALQHPAGVGEDESLNALQDRLKGLDRLEDLFADLEAFLQELGFYQYLYTTVPDFFHEEPSSRQPVLESSYDPGWMDYYLDRSYDQHDYALHKCLSNTDGTPLIWEDHLQNHSPMQYRVYQQATEVDIQRGVSFPILNSIGSFSALGVTYKGSSASFRKLIEEKQQILLQYATVFNEAVNARHGAHFGEPYRPQLTRTEVEIIRYLANGHTRPEIANRKHRSIGTIDKQVNGIIQKLHARNMTHAVALCLRWGFI